MRYPVTLRRAAVPVSAVMSTVGSFIVDEVVNELAVGSHPDIIWSPSFQSLVVPPWPGDIAPDWWWDRAFAPDDGPAGNTYPNTTGIDMQVVSAGFSPGLNCFRCGSQYTGHYVQGDGPPPTWGNTPAFTGSACECWSYFKYMRDGTGEPLAATPLGTTPITAAWLRGCVMPEDDWDDGGFVETGCKLFGFQFPNPVTMGHTFKLYPPGTNGAPAGYCRVVGYLSGNDIPGSSGPGSIVDVDFGVNIPLGEFSSFETYLRPNSAIGASDGQRIFYVNDVEVFRTDNANMTDAGGTTFEIHSVHGQIFFGGTTPPGSPQMHTRVTGFHMARRRIGMPKELR